MEVQQQITAAIIMAIYGVTRPTVTKWFNDGLIEGQKGAGVTDSWVADAPALKRFHLDHIQVINVWDGSGKLINLPGPYKGSISDLAKLLGVNRSMAYRYLKYGYVPGAIKLPYLGGDWRLPEGYKPVALARRANKIRDKVQIGPPIMPLPPIEDC